MRSATIGFTVDDSAKAYDIVGVLSLPEVGTRQVGAEQTEVKAASWRTSATNSKSELVMVPEGLLKLTKAALMSSGHSNCHR